MGPITSHAYGGEAKIINCCNKAEAVGCDRAGAICVNTGEGLLINCVNPGGVRSESASAILSHNTGFVGAVYPEQLPESFTGYWLSVPPDEGDVDHMLNSGIALLIEQGVLSPVD